MGWLSWIMTANVLGGGAEAVRGRYVTVHYTRWVYDPCRAGNKGQQIDSSRDLNRTFAFRLGNSRVHPAWNEGIAGMKVGGRRTLIIPPGTGHETRPVNGLNPADLTLVFDVELLDVGGGLASPSRLSTRPPAAPPDPRV